MIHTHGFFYFSQQKLFCILQRNHPKHMEMSFRCWSSCQCATRQSLSVPSTVVCLTDCHFKEPLPLRLVGLCCCDTSQLCSCHHSSLSGKKTQGRSSIRLTSGSKFQLVADLVWTVSAGCKQKVKRVVASFSFLLPSCVFVMEFHARLQQEAKRRRNRKTSDDCVMADFSTARPSLKLRQPQLTTRSVTFIPP